MTVEELIEMFSHIPKDYTVLIEYMPRAHEYISELALGLRADHMRNNVIIFGPTDTFE
jgi:hypothetical protein